MSGLLAEEGFGTGVELLPSTAGSGELAGEKVTSVDLLLGLAGMAIERWERISKRNAMSTSTPTRLPQNQIEGSNREFKMEPAIVKRGKQRLGTVDHTR